MNYFEKRVNLSCKNEKHKDCVFIKQHSIVIKNNIVYLKVKFVGNK